jgi:hypothetical protein
MRHSKGPSLLRILSNRFSKSVEVHVQLLYNLRDHLNHREVEHLKHQFYSVGTKYVFFAVKINASAVSFVKPCIPASAEVDGTSFM